MCSLESYSPIKRRVMKRTTIAVNEIKKIKQWMKNSKRNFLFQCLFSKKILLGFCCVLSLNFSFLPQKLFPPFHCTRVAYFLLKYSFLKAHVVNLWQWYGVVWRANDHVTTPTKFIELSRIKACLLFTKFLLFTASLNKSSYWTLTGKQNMYEFRSNIYLCVSSLKIF